MINKRHETDSLESIRGFLVHTRWTYDGGGTVTGDCCFTGNQWGDALECRLTQLDLIAMARFDGCGTPNGDCTHLGAGQG